MLSMAANSPMHATPISGGPGYQRLVLVWAASLKNRRKRVTSSQRLNTAGVDRTAFATILCPKMSGASFGQSVLETSPLDILVNVRLKWGERSLLTIKK